MADDRNAPELFPHAELALDLENPRSPGNAFASPIEALKYLVGFADVNELVGSILTAGWLDFEPLVVDRRSHVVYEGNRRLAALRLITDPGVRAELGYELPLADEGHRPPQEIYVKFVDGRDEARAYIGFKHINGPHKWDALAKAKFAADWLSSPGASLSSVAKALGDAHSTVRRLVNGWRVLQQALSDGFDPSPQATGKARFPFSHLYTAVARPNVRHYLGLDPDAELFGANPITADALPNLRQLMQWLYGQGKKPAVVQTQNPDLNKLVDVLGSPTAIAHLVSNGTLSAAFEIVEDKVQRFREALLKIVGGVDDASRLVRNYTGGADDLATVSQVVRGVNLLRRSMQDIADGVEPVDAN